MGQPLERRGLSERPLQDAPPLGLELGALDVQTVRILVPGHATTTVSRPPYSIPGQPSPHRCSVDAQEALPPHQLTHASGASCNRHPAAY